MQWVLFLSVFLIASCGLIYELVAGTLSSYLLGDSVLQFSTVIGTYLFAMGVGSYASKGLQTNLIEWFLRIEILVGVIGGFSAPALFAAFGFSDAFRPILYGLVFAIGLLVGLEIPLLMRILKGRIEFKDLVANVLTFDYLGSLGASLLFPLVLVPQLGLVRSSLAFGLLNVAVAIWGLVLFRERIVRKVFLTCASILAMLLLLGGFWKADLLASMADEKLFSDEVILSRQSTYQRIVLTKWKDDLRLFLNGHLQFSSRDEYRYHESLVHPGLAALPGAKNVLVLGGGDGMAVREVLKYPVQKVTLVDLDPMMTKLFQEHPVLKGLNANALLDKRVKVINDDAFVWLDQQQEIFDFVVVDFPDPSSFAIGKLYTVAFYRLLQKHVADQGWIVVQSTSPMFARQAYWSINETLKASGLKTWPYHAYVPAFGEWGFVLAGRGNYDQPKRLPANLRFLTPVNLPQLFIFPPDMAAVPTEPNRLNDQNLVRYYESEWNSAVR
jgi:spermidine synthase